MAVSKGSYYKDTAQDIGLVAELACPNLEAVLLEEKKTE